MVVGCWGWMEGKISCGSLKKEMELVVWELCSCVKTW